MRDRLLLATTRTAADESLRQARAGETTQWPTAHYLSPLHPVLDWAVDRALSQLGRNHVPVALADVEVPTAITLGTLSNHRGQVVLRSIVAQEFHDGAVEPMVVEDVAGVLDDSRFTEASVNTGAAIDLVRHQPLIPTAVSQMRRYMQTLHTLRVAALVEPIEQAKERIAGWSEQAEALAASRAPAQATKLRRDIERTQQDANQLAESFAARPDPMVRVLLLLLPREEGQ